MEGDDLMADARTTFRADLANSDSCTHEAKCYFAQTVVRNPVLKVKYAALRRYCRGGDSSQCARLQALAAGGVVADNLLPDGTVDVSLSGKPYRVLVVDDIPVFRKLMEGIVANSIKGVEILSAGNGEEALSVIASDHVDLVVTDYNMPGMSGGDLLKALRHESLSRHVPVLVFTTEASSALRADVLSYDCVRWVEKSPHRAEFAQAVNELLIQGLK